jgi:hypothetical protein
LWGDPTRLAPDAYWGTWLFDSSLPWLLSIHLGAPILLLAAAGAWAKRRGAGGRAAILAAIGMALALGSSTPLYPFLVKWIPGAANVRFPIKWFLLTAWCAAILAGSGFDHLMARVRPRGGRGESVGLLSAAAAFGLGVVMALGALPSMSGIVRAMFDVPPAVTDDVLAHGAVRTIGSSLAMAAGSILLLLVFRPRDAVSAPLRSRLAAGLCCGILWFGARGLQPSAPIEAVFEPSPLLKAMPEVMAGRLRFFGFPRPPGFAFRTPSPEYAAAAGLPPDSLAWGMRWDVRTLRYATIFPWGVKGAYDRTGDSRLDLLPGSALSLKLKEGGVTLPEAVRLLSASSVGYLLAHADLDHPDLSEVASLPGESNVPVKLYKIASPVPRAELVERAEEVASFDEALGKIGSGAADPHAVVLLGPISGGGAGIEGPAADGGGVPMISGSATITRDDPCEVDVRVNAGRPAWLVLTDTFESTWRARLDGAAVPILRANAMFRAIRVPAGDHEVVFSYLPLSIVLGCGISVLSIASGVGVIVAGRRPRAS